MNLKYTWKVLSEFQHLWKGTAPTFILATGSEEANVSTRNEMETMLDEGFTKYQDAAMHVATISFFGFGHIRIYNIEILDLGKFSGYFHRV